MVYTICSQTSGTSVWFWALAPNWCNYCALKETVLIIGAMASMEICERKQPGMLAVKNQTNRSDFIWYSPKVEKVEQARPCTPPLPSPPMGSGGGSGTYTIIVNWQKKNNRFLARGGEIRQRAWGSPEGRHGSLYSSHKSFPFGPNEDLAGGRGTAGSAMSSHSLASMFSVLWGKGVL